MPPEGTEVMNRHKQGRTSLEPVPYLYPLILNLNPVEPRCTQVLGVRVRAGTPGYGQVRRGMPRPTRDDEIA